MIKRHVRRSAALCLGLAVSTSPVTTGAAAAAAGVGDYKYVCTNDQPVGPPLPRVCVPLPV